MAAGMPKMNNATVAAMICMEYLDRRDTRDPHHRGRRIA